MRASSTLLLALGVVCVLPRARAEDPAKIDPAAQVDQLTPSPDTTKPVEKVDLKHDDQVQDSRAALAGLLEEPQAPVAERRAPIDMTETREKNMIDHKDAPLSTDPLPHKDSPMAGQTARDSLQPNGNGTAFRQSNAVAEKYQQGIQAADAANAASVQRPADLNKQTTFDKLNRFIFKRNGPGTDGGAALVTAAGGGPATVLPTSPNTPAPAAGSALGGSVGGIELLGIGVAPGRPPPAAILVPPVSK